MSGYVPNNRNERIPPPKEPYNGDFSNQQTRAVEGTTVQPVNSLVGLRFMWDNGECLGANIPYSLTPAGANVIRGGLDARGCLTQTIQGREYDAQLLADADVDNDVAKARTELQSALDEILSAERAEAAELQTIQDQRSSFMNGVHKSLAFGKGLFMAGVGLVDSAKQLNDLISPHTYLSNALRAAWNAKPAGGSRWVDSFLENFSDEQHRELVEALGFDPSSITREQLADAYEIANFIYDDGPSKGMLGRFAVDYAQAQNIEEMAEFGGGAAFEIILTAILAVFTGGVFIGIKAATSMRHLAKLKRLGNALTKLSAALKRARIKAKGRVRGAGTGAQTVEVPRPAGVKAEKIEAPKDPANDQVPKAEAPKKRVHQDPNTTWNPQDYPETPANQLPDYDGKNTLGKMEIDGETYYVKNGKGQPGETLKTDPSVKAGAVSPTHAEGHAVAIMRETGTKEAVLDINHPTGPCGFCDKVMENMLPEGSKLTVNWPNGSQIFTGNSK
ncbi:DddA-like double-stranded DNA deaminase toxin [Pseudomonas benzenivorans]|uniref:Uncharacterized protein n=1 Tax=Pseudomonas benzenivorans TaxID=556533 RepID=A0ABY5H8P3_9PSED|nr:DddA-like double-stranded DNA deaminase toxin [Pseudomonas benzenivorans]UTW07998.1 hypothetical protein KDW96_01280 [Pseudomonas benzenivorans]